MGMHPVTYISIVLGSSILAHHNFAGNILSFFQATQFPRHSAARAARRCGGVQWCGVLGQSHWVNHSPSLNMGITLKDWIFAGEKTAERASSFHHNYTIYYM
jgi:hypothetical protein